MNGIPADGGIKLAKRNCKLAFAMTPATCTEGPGNDEEGWRFTETPYNSQRRLIA